MQTDPEPLGKLGCVAAGSVTVGGACTRGPAGESTGFDDCAAGLICQGGTCQEVCGFDGTPDAACATEAACIQVNLLFANGDDEPVAGICRATCDPLTGTLAGGGTCATGQGCYPVSNDSTSFAVCAPAASTLTHGQAITGPGFINSCAPGFVPRVTARGASTLECTALCKPADVTSTTNMQHESGVEPFSCVTQGASPPSSGTSGEYCQYFWARERFAGLSPLSNTLGTCFKHATWQFDSDGDNTPDMPWPRCITLTTGDIIPPHGTPAEPDNDALDFACIAFPSSFARNLTRVLRTVEPLQLDTLAP